MKGLFPKELPMLKLSHTKVTTAVTAVTTVTAVTLAVAEATAAAATAAATTAAAATVAAATVAAAAASMMMIRHARQNTAASITCAHSARVCVSKSSDYERYFNH